MNLSTKLDAVPTIDYEAHPAFHGLESGGATHQSPVDRLVQEIDEQLRRIRFADGRTAEQRSAEFVVEISPRMQELQRLAVSARSLRPMLAEYTTISLDLAHRFLRESIEARSAIPGSESSAGAAALSSERYDRLVELQRMGFCRFLAEQELASRIWAATRWERELLKVRARDLPTRHSVLPLQAQSPGALLVKDMIHHAGILEIASAYIGKPMDFLYAALDLSHHGQTWYRDCYADAGIPTSKTVYLHFDADSDVMKAMFYLREVDGETGPFKFLRGSHLWKRSPLVGAVQRGFDQAQGKYFEVEPDGLDFKFGYYRPRFKVVDHRKDTLALPAALRGSTHFGDDVLDGSVLSERLLLEEETFTGPAGTLVLFDGSQGVHRGSLVTCGQRWAIQIGLRVKKGNPSPVRRMLKSVKGHAAYQAVRARGWVARSGRKPDDAD
jgi:hypothetical protein